MSQNQTIETILNRRSIRSYKPDPISESDLNTIIEAGQRAPYVWEDCRHFTVVKDRDLISRLNAAAIKAGSAINKEMREIFQQPGFDGTYGAPCIIIVSGNEAALQHEAICGASIENMLIAAKALGLGSCWVYFVIFAFHGEDAASFKEELQIPEGFKPCAGVLLGYETEPFTEEEDVRWKNGVTFIKGK
ncbi:MAG: nitroreductase family protein [Erysipelotrichaceae bacterium]|jgi:nitroreductase|nr:nitroreductase family protein [Erysipelotrichaceae bacterium]